MLKIRLQRVGRKHEPTFRLVLTDSKNSTKSGKFNEILGSYDARKSTDQLKVDRINYWLSNGAQPSDTVHNLLVTHKVIDAKKRNVLPKKTAPVKVEEPVKAEEPAVENAPAEQEEVPISNEAEAEAPAEPVAENTPAETEETPTPEEV
jgi:small subunit ribosomal protein S16